MKRNWKFKVGFATGLLIAAYLSGPIIAGSWQIGNRLGPRIYPRSLHEVLYIVAHESVHNIKPRVPIDTSLYDRPWFYGQSRTPKTPEERQAVLDRHRENQSPMFELLTERNRKIDQGEPSH